MDPAVPMPPPEDAHLPRAPMVAAAALAVVAAVVGLLPWPRPQLSTTSALLVSDVPGPLWALVLGLTVLCLGIAVLVTARAAGFSTRAPATWAWFGLLILSTAALVWNAVYSAALSTTAFGALIPVFHWLFTFAPAVLAGLLVARRGREARWAAALGTGVVTLPLFALSTSLLHATGFSVGDLVASLAFTTQLGVAPLVGGVALAGALGGTFPIGRIPQPH